MESLHELVLPVLKDSKVSKIPFPQFLTVGPQDQLGPSVFSLYEGGAGKFLFSFIFYIFVISINTSIYVLKGDQSTESMAHYVHWQQTFSLLIRKAQKKNLTFNISTELPKILFPHPQRRNIESGYVLYNCNGCTSLMLCN